MFVLGQAPKGAQRPAVEMTAELYKQALSEPGWWRKYFTWTSVGDPDGVDGSLVMKQTSSLRQKSASYLAKETKCPGQLKGSQMDKPMGRVGVGGDSLRKMGLTIDAHNVCTPISTWHAPAMVLPWSGYETSERVILQPLDMRQVMKDLMHWSSWLGRKIATTTWRSCNERNWATVIPWSCQSLEAVSLSLKQREWMR